MIIDFNTMAPTVLKNFKGGEKSVSAAMFSDGAVRIMFGSVEVGASIGLHTHEDSCEIIYYYEGTGKAICDGVEERIVPGVCHYCPKGHSHTIINDGDTEMKFFACVPQQ